MTLTGPSWIVRDGGDGDNRARDGIAAAFLVARHPDATDDVDLLRGVDLRLRIGGVRTFLDYVGVLRRAADTTPLVKRVCNKENEAALSL